MKRFFQTIILTFILIKAFGQDIDVYFDFNSSEIKKDELIKIHQIINKDCNKVNLFGYTDTAGNNNYNKLLAERRINSVSKIINEINNNINISFINYGEDSSNLPFDNLNRRVHIKIGKSDISFKEDTQIFKINPASDTVIKGLKGTQIKIYKNSFSFLDNQLIKTEVVIKLLEYYSNSDMILANLTTTSNRKQLITGGMIYLAANDANKSSEIKLNKNIEVAFSDEENNDSMMIFYGEKHNNGINWIPELDTVQITEDPAFVIVEESATFLGGDINNFRQFMQKTITIPSSIDVQKLDNKKAIVQFAVNSKGRIEDIKMLRGINNQIDSLIKVALIKAPNWEPGRQGGNPIKQQFVIPVVVDDNYLFANNKFQDSTFYRNYVDSINRNNDLKREAANDVYRNVSKLGWINCDQFYNSPNLISVKFNYQRDSEKVYVVFKRIRSIIALNDFTLMPKNENVTILSICKDGDKYLFGRKDIKLTNEPISLTYETIDYKQLKEKLNLVK